MNYLDAFILGLIQGFSEWLPISSSGHLVLAQEIFNIKANAEFDIIIMGGTTLALIIYFRKKIFSILEGIIKKQKDSIEYVKYLLIAGLITAIVGFSLKNLFKSFFYSPALVAIFLIINGFYILIASSIKTKKRQLNSLIAAFVGLAQGIAITPGISRSGSTISSAILLGVDKTAAAQFSFLLGIPSMLVASLIEFLELKPLQTGLDIYFVGFLAAFIAGYLSIDFFMKIIKKEKYNLFGYYCILVGIIAYFLVIKA